MKKSRARYTRVELASIVPRAESVSSMGKRQFKALLESVRTLGQLQPLVVRDVGGGKFEIVDGAWRHKALTEANILHADVLNLGSVPEETALEIHLALNLNRGKPKPRPLANVLEKATGGDARREIRVWRQLPLTGKSVTHVVSKLRSKTERKPPVKHDPNAQPSFVDFKMRVPPDAAMVCDQALSHIESNHGVKRPRAFELLAADYLSGTGVQSP